MGGWLEYCKQIGMNRTATPPHALRLVVIAPDLSVADADDDSALALIERSRQLRIGLLEGGFNLVATLPPDVFLSDRLAQLQPDMIIVDAESDARDALEHVVVATRDERRPIVMFTDDPDRPTMRSAIGAGVSAYVVRGLKPERVQAVIDVAVERFAGEQALRGELDAARSELADRKTIDRAKRLLMTKKNLSEPEAHRFLQDLAMKKSLKLRDAAERVIDVESLLG